MDHQFFSLNLTTEQGAQVRRALTKTRGLKLITAHAGVFSVGPVVAAVRIYPGDCMRVTLRVDQPPTPSAALETNYQLPGNVRFAAESRRLMLLADTQVDGEVHLAQSFSEIKSGLFHALGEKRTRERKTKPVTAEQVQAALERTTWDEESIVQRDAGWELRPRLHGQVVPVRATLVESRLHLRRRIISMPASEIASTAVAQQALRYNVQLKQARLSANEGEVYAESRLHAGLITPGWLVASATAVAVGWQHVTTALRILAEREEVAESYVKMFQPDLS